MLQTYYIVRYTNNARNTASQTYKPRRYASSNKGTPALLRTKHCCYAAYLLNIEERTTFYAMTTLYTPLLVCLSIATTLCRKVIAAYALNYLKLQFLSANIIALISIVLYNAIKEYYNDRTRKIIYFYSYTVENKCRTSYSNKKDIEADKREDEFAMLAEKYIIDNRIIYALALIKDK
ncbi:hypothetical protein HBI37_229130 [Parastagonospora nodorum]|nr:hypothetical protein HBI37_229130 [Parastagonospora nodorum]